MKSFIPEIKLRKEYNFSKMKGRKNPYAKDLKKQVILRLRYAPLRMTERISNIESQLLLSQCDYFCIRCLMAETRSAEPTTISKTGTRGRFGL